MTLDNLFEGVNPQMDIMTQKSISSQRTPRLRLKTLLRLRRIRERRKLEKLKDMELYYIMYGKADESGGM